MLFGIFTVFQSALEVRWCADADISAVLYLRPTPEVPMRAGWLKRDEAVAFETHIVETDDDDKGLESWAQLKAILSRVLVFLTDTVKVSCSGCAHTQTSFCSI